MPADIKAPQQIMKLNARTAEMILGYNRWHEYVRQLMEETGLPIKTVRDGLFAFSRATNFDGGAFTDLGSCNVTFYNELQYPTRGHNIIVKDPS